MYEGKNIHFSPLDNKPLCSYSAKVCKQRRLNGYSLCLRHVLEDPGAPFRQCLYIAKNKQQCTNPIHKNNDAQFCTSHLQLLGLIPIGTKSCSKASRGGEGKLVKNGLHSSSSPCQEDHLRNKNKASESAGSLNESLVEERSDPYTFSDVDPPKTLKFSPPLLSMVAEVSGIQSCLQVAPMCTGGSRPVSVSQEPNRSIPISRLYPELVEKLESDRNRSNPKPKTGRNLRTSNNVQNRNCLTKTKLKKCNSPSDMPATVGDSLLPGANTSLSTLMCHPVVSSESAKRLLGSVDISCSSKLDLTSELVAISSSSLDTQNATLISRSQWMLPVFEPQVSQQPMPVMQTFSKALSGLLNPLAIFKPSVQPEFTSGSLQHSSVTNNALFRSQSEPQRRPVDDNEMLMHQMQAVTSSSNSHCLASLDLNLNGSLVSRSLGTQHMNKVCSTMPVLTSSSNVPSSAALGSEVLTSCIKSSSAVNSEEAQPSVSTVTNYFVQPRPRAHHFSDKEARRKVRRKHALKIYLEHATRVTENLNLLPTGVDSSDEEEDLDHVLPWQRLWNDLSSDEGEGDFDLAEDVASNIRRTKLQLLKSKMRRQFTQLQRCHEGNASVRCRHRETMDYLITSCRQNTDATVEALKLIRNVKWNSSSNRANDVRLRKRPCLHRNDNDVVCNSVALPYTNQCMRHIMYNVDQLLFGYCTAKASDKTQCCVPVFDIKHELPLCPEHMIKDGSQENQELKPKKQRKKTKPSALTRPPKKGKKKKCQRKTVDKPQKPVIMLDNCPHSGHLSVEEAPSSCVTTSSSFSSSLLTSSSPMAAVSSLTRSVASAGACMLLGSEAVSKDSMDDDGLGSDLDVTFSPTGIPIDNDQATSFLDEHELHEMLNKMADEAFELSSGKNGGYPSSKEVEEELVRALVEVTKTLSDSKDVRLGQLSHEHMLLPDGSNEDELTKQIADSLLNRNALSPSGSVSDDQDNLSDLASSLTVHDLKSISQVMESSMMNHALELCPTALNDSQLQPPETNAAAVGYLNGCGMLQHYAASTPAHEHSTGTTCGFAVLDQLQLSQDSHHRRMQHGIISFPLTSNGMLESISSSSSSSSSLLTPLPVPPLLPSILTSVLPLALGNVSASHMVVSASHPVSGIASSQMPRGLPPPQTSGEESFGQAFQSLPDIQTLMKQPPAWRLGDSPSFEFRPSTVPPSLSTQINFPNQLSYLSSFHHQPQFLVSESKIGGPVLHKNELMPESFSTIRTTVLPETSSVDLVHSGANNMLSTINKILNSQLPSTP